MDAGRTRSFYDASYRSAGFGAQRRYPNEEMLRFIARHYGAVPFPDRRSISLLEAGCGSGANLWALAREGFDAHGLDLSAEGLALCAEMLRSWNVQAELREGDMTSLPYAPAAFDAVLDVFSSYCLDEPGFARFLDDVTRVLKPGGRFFTFTPHKGSDAFTNHAPARLLDACTLDGIRRETSPYAGNLYPFRFTTNEELAEALGARGFDVTSSEQVRRSYRNGAEWFAFAVVAAEKRA